MRVAQSVAEILSKHVVLEVEGIDRMYLNVYVPRLQIIEGALGFMKNHLGHKVASTKLVEPITRRFVAAIEQFVQDHAIPMICFSKGQRKDEVATRFRADFSKKEGVVFVGKAQEKCTVYRTERRRNPRTGRSYAWIVKSAALVNQYYFYCVDRDFGPFFLKFCSYFPYNAKLCLNGHEYVKRQLDQEGIAYEALDNGILSCKHPRRLQSLCNALTAEKIDALLRKWLARLPHPFSARDRQAGYRYDLSILQIELSLTQVLDRPVTGLVPGIAVRRFTGPSDLAHKPVSRLRRGASPICARSTGNHGGHYDIENRLFPAVINITIGPVLCGQNEDTRRRSGNSPIPQLRSIGSQVAKLSTSHNRPKGFEKHP